MRIIVTASALCMTIIGLSMADDVHASIRQTTNIPAQPLAPALQSLAKDRNFQIVYVSEEIGDRRTTGAVGEFTSEEALKKLLSGTGLTYKYLDDKTVTILPINAKTPRQARTESTALEAPGADNTKGARKDTSNSFRLAQASQGDSESDASVEKDSDQQASQQKPSKLEEVVVTGSRLARTAKEGVQEVKVYTKEQIDQSGQTTLSEFLNTLPQVSLASSENTFVANFGMTSVQLHGLPLGTTLVLLNGRRIETSGGEGAQSGVDAFDLNTIPIAAVERIEVVSEGSSAIYGSDAIAGVVNVILKKDFDGVEADVKYGFAKGVEESNTEFAWGGHSDRGSVSIIGNFQTRSGLVGTQRPISASQDFRPYGATDQRYNACDPGNVFSTDGSNLPGLNAPYAAVPANYTGTPSLREFGNTAGMLNACNYHAADSIIPESRRAGLLGSASYNVNSSLELFTELMYSHTQAYMTEPEFFMYGVPGDQQFTVAAGNPYNPFGETVGVAGLQPSVANSNTFGTVFYRALAGARGEFLGSWQWEVSAGRSRDRSEENEPFLNPTRTQAALDSTDRTTALNPFVSGAYGSPQLLSSVIDAGRLNYIGSLDQVSGFVRGPIARLPSGPVQVVLGGEYDRGTLFSHITNVYYFPPSDNYTYHRDSYAVFGESRLPILANHAHPQSGDVLAATVAGRFDHYNDFGNQTTPQYGLEWRPVESLLIRGGYSEAFKAPALVDLYLGGAVQQSTATDPLNGNQTVSVTQIYGGNTHLKPETGLSRTLGFVYSSNAIPDLQLSLTHWAVVENNAAQLLPVQEIIDNASLFPGRVVRGPGQNGQPGPILSVDDTFVNFGLINVSGFDYQLNYKLRTAWGEFSPSISATQTVHYLTKLTPDAPQTEQASKASDSFNWAPRWKGTVALSWKLASWSASLDGRYVSKYRDYDPLPDGTYLTLGNFWLFDANVHYAVGHALAQGNRWLQGSYIELGGVNLLNTLPQFSNLFGGYTGFDPTQSDIRGRFLYARAGIKW